MKASKLTVALALSLMAQLLQAQAFQWARNFSGNYYGECATSITSDPAGNVYTVGTYNFTQDFDPGAGSYTLSTEASASGNAYVTKMDANGNFLWARSMECDLMSYATSVKSDASGNVIFTGIYGGVVDLDPGAAVSSFSTSGSEIGIFVCKLDGSGNYMWGRCLQGTGVGSAGSLKLDAAGNVHISGSFEGLVDFDPSAAVYTLNAASNPDAFVVKLDATGNFLWARQFVGNDISVAASIDVDGLGNVYTAGFYRGETDFNPGVASFTYTSSDRSIFVSKLDVMGNFVWAKSMGGANDEAATAIMVDAGNNVYTTGSFSSSGDFNPSTSVVFSMTAVGQNDIFISKLDVNGNFVWARQIGGAGDDQVNGMTGDLLGAVYLTGSFSGTVDFDPGVGTMTLNASGLSGEAYIAKLNMAGNYAWAGKIGGTGEVTGRAINLRSTGELYTTGSFNSTVDFDPSAASTTLTALGNGNVLNSYVQKMQTCSPSDPSPTVAVNGGSLCLGSTFAINPSGAYNYNIQGGSAIVSPTTTTTYSVVGTSSTGCESSPVTLTVTVQSFTMMTSSNATICSGTQLTLTANGSSASGYTWEVPGGSAVNSSSVAFSNTVAARHVYTITGVGANGCSDTAMVYITVDKCTGLGELKAETNVISVYPNPNKGEFIVKANAGTNLQIINILGATVRTVVVSPSGDVSIEDLNKGVYFISGEDNGWRFNKKIIVE